jgi:hypothetical protein
VTDVRRWTRAVAAFARIARPVLRAAPVVTLVAPALALALMLAVPAARAQAPPHLVRMLSVESTPAMPDSLARSFLSGFRGAFLDESFATERPAARAGEIVVSVPIANHFALLMGSGSDDAWQAQVTLEWPAADTTKATPRGPAASRKGTRTTRGSRPPSKGGDSTATAARSPAAAPSVVVTWWALSPEALAANARPLPRRERLTFARPVTPASAYQRFAGRSVALLVLEALHHASGDLDAAERLRLPDCTRGAP